VGFWDKRLPGYLPRPSMVARVVLAAAHLDSDPPHNRLANLRTFWQRCNMLNDRPDHLAQRWIA